jgi:trehalose synthase
MMGLHEMDTVAVPLPRLAAVLAPDRAARLIEYQRLSRSLLEGRIVWNLNSTGEGGGVAEMLRALIAYGRGAGIETRWLVIEGSPDFFAITKRVHNRLHGFHGDGGELDTRARQLYAERLEAVLPALTNRVRAGDLVVLHDPQTAGLVEPLRAHGARVIWRCHVGADMSNSHTEQAWSFLHGFVADAEAFVFSRRAYAPSWVPEERLRIIPPSLDPLSPKNADMAPAELAATLHRIPSGDGGPLPRDGRVILQVSRWDRLKDMAGVLRAFADHQGGLPRDLRLVLAGPEPGRVDDDPEGAEVLAECRELRDSLEPGVRSRVHLSCLPMDDLVENARMVNALQRHATVVVQKSLAEGFGLTVTEPMWKSRPVVASAVGGIPDQIVDRESGFLLRDPRDLAGFADLIRIVVSDPEGSNQVGRAAHQRARELFLPDRHLIQYVDLFTDLLGR